MIKVIEKDKDMIKIEMDSPTITEALRKELWNDKNVIISAWNREHPTKNPVLIVKTKSETPVKAIREAVSRIQKINDSIRSEFKKSVK